MKSKLVCSALVVLTLLSGPVHAAVVAEWDITNANAGTANTVAVASTDANASASVMTSFGALGAAFNSFGTFCYADWATGAVDLSKYYEFTVSPDGGWGVIYDTMTMYAASGGSGTCSVQVRSSLDGYGSVLASGTFPATSSWHFVSLDISGAGSQLSSVTFRLYIHDAPASGFTGLGQSPTFGSGGNLFVNGDVLEAAVANSSSSWGGVKALYR